MSNIAKILLESINKNGYRKLLDDKTYNNLYSLSNIYLSHMNKLNIRNNSRICVKMDKSIDYIAIMLAIWRNNCVFVPIPDYNKKVIDIVKPSLLIDYKLDNKYVDIKENINNSITDPAMILFTSGTTSDPKGVILSHKNIIRNIEKIDKRYNNIIDHNDISFSLLPWYHSYGLVCELIYMLSKGAKIYVPDINLSPKEKLRKISEVKPTLIYTVPRMIESIYKKRNNYFDYLLPYGIKKRLIFGNNIRMMSVGGSSCNSSLIYYMLNNYNIPVYEGYGMTELSPMVSLNSPTNNKIGSSGKILDNIDIKIIDREIIVKSDSLMKGYLTKEGFKESTEWFNTGDTGYLDEDNYLYITGRKHKMIYKLNNGKYVNPSYLENILLLSEHVDQVCYYEEDGYNNCLIYTAGKRDVKKIYDYIDILVLTDKMAKYEIPKKIKYIDEPFSQENGCLSLKLDLKRDKIRELYLLR